MTEKATALDERLVAFLGALRGAEGNEFCRPPGLSGVYKVKWIRMGLDTEALAAHRSGRGLANVIGPDHSGRNCKCPNCTWEYIMGREDTEADPAPMFVIPIRPGKQSRLFGVHD